MISGGVQAKTFCFPGVGDFDHFDHVVWRVLRSVNVLFPRCNIDHHVVYRVLRMRRLKVYERTRVQTQRAASEIHRPQTPPTPPTPTTPSTPASPWQQIFHVLRKMIFVCRGFHYHLFLIIPFSDHCLPFVLDSLNHSSDSVVENCVKRKTKSSEVSSGKSRTQ